MKKPEYEVVACEDNLRGLRVHGEHDTPVILLRRNPDGCYDMVAKFHSRFYAEKFAAVLNSEVGATA